MYNWLLYILFLVSLVWYSPCEFIYRGYFMVLTQIALFQVQSESR
jgi:hypothetical protein